MKILGIHDGHNAAAALVVDGRVVAAVQEERFNRVKNWNGFPARAVKWVLEEGGLAPKDLDTVAMASLHMPYPRDRETMLEEYRRSGSLPTRLRRLARHTGLRTIHGRRRRAVRVRDAVASGLPAERLRFVEHHSCHASAAYYGWGRHEDPVLVLTNDGAGDRLCASVSTGRDGRLTRIAGVPEAASIGNVYAVVTFLMGMVPMEHEYKLMGLAPYAPESGSNAVLERLRPLLRLTDDGTTWRRGEGLPETHYSYTFLRKRLELHRFDWICGGLQAWTEELLVDWVRACIRATGIRRVALSGGVFMNVKANKLISELSEVDDLFVFPSCGDETNAMGAAWWMEADEGTDGSHIPPLGDLYWGPSYDDTAVEQALSQHPGRGGWTIEREDEIDVRVAELLAEGEIVARCTGRAEFGARALGNRSILADPTRRDVVREINDMIKSRDFWMPFAPALLPERADDYLVNPKRLRAPYMILAFDTTSLADELAAAIHPYDLSARPQVVDEEWNPGLHQILTEFQRRTGRGGILNTSFNLHGYPIVNAPDEALQVFADSGLRRLALNGYLITKGA